MAWRRLVERYERLVYSVPLQYGVAPDDAADVAQATFSALLRQLGEIREPERLGAWLATVARRETWRLWERRRDDVPVEAVAEPGGDDDALGRVERLLWLDRGLSRLDRRCRALLTLLYLDPDEPSYAKIATRLGIAVGSIGPTRARCLAKLRPLLEDAPPVPRQSTP